MYRRPILCTLHGAVDFLKFLKIVPSAARDNLRGQKSLGPLKMSLEMAHKVIVPQKKIMSRSFLNSGTLIVSFFTGHYFASLVPIAQQAGQAVVQCRLSLTVMCVSGQNYVCPCSMVKISAVRISLKNILVLLKHFIYATVICF
jgi:hypothetical protein